MPIPVVHVPVPIGSVHPIPTVLLTPISHNPRPHLRECMKVTFGKKSTEGNGFWATVCNTFRPMLSDRCLSCCDVGVLWPNGSMDQDETWCAGRPRPWPHCVRWGPSSSPPKRHSPPIFGPYMLWPNGWMD